MPSGHEIQGVNLTNAQFVRFVALGQYLRGTNPFVQEIPSKLKENLKITQKYASKL